MVVAAFVAPYLLEATARFVVAAAGLPGVRLGSTPYAAYHSASDVPAVVDPRQLERAARIVVAWLR